MSSCVLAYSGGLDTSVILGWLRDEGYDVHAVYVDLGQPCEDRAATLDKAREMGAAKKAGDWWHLPMDSQARGKLVIGDVTLLFQFVQAPPVVPRGTGPEVQASNRWPGQDRPASAIANSRHPAARLACLRDRRRGRSWS